MSARHTPSPWRLSCGGRTAGPGPWYSRPQYCDVLLPTAAGPGALGPSCSTRRSRLRSTRSPARARWPWLTSTATGISTAHIYDDGVSVLLGRGDGTFAAKADYAVGGEPVALALGDVDGDSRLDIVTANYGSDSVSILLGKGDGRLVPAETIRPGPPPTRWCWVT